MRVCVENDTDAESTVAVKNEIFELGADGLRGRSHRRAGGGPRPRSPRASPP